MKPHRGTLILVLGILGFMVCGFVGTAAWIMGNNDLREMDMGYMDPSGRDQTNIGRILGIISTVLAVIAILAAGAFLLMLLVAGGMQMR